MDYLLTISVTTASLCALDFIASKFYNYYKPSVQVVPHNARWFLIHSVTNLFITLTASHDLFLCFTDPDNALTISSPLTKTALVVALTMHAYHTIVFYKHLTPTDITHHAVMCGISGPLSLYYTSRLTGAGLWFLTGLPGAIDYFLLWLVKIEAFERMREKEAYILISTWVRSPGCVICCYIAAKNLGRYPAYIQIPTLINALLIGWNGQYYLSQTSIDFGKSKAKAKNLDHVE